MSDERWKASFDLLAEAKLVKPDLKYTEGYTLKFVNKGSAKYKS